MTAPLTLADRISELYLTPHRLELFKRLHLWKYYIHHYLGDRFIPHINAMVREVLQVSYTCRDVDEALERVMSPNHPRWVILHDYPEVAAGVTQYLLQGTDEHLLNRERVQEAEDIAYREMRVELNNLYQR